MEINACFKSSNDVVALPVPTTEIIEISYVEDSKKIIVPVDDNFSHYSTKVEDTLLILNKMYIGKRLTIKLLCGYSELTIPPAMRGAILLILGTIYDNASSDLIGKSSSLLSITADNILEKYRLNPY